MLQNGDKVRAKKSESSAWIEPVRFVGCTESKEFVCESKGEISRFRFAEKLKTKTVEPMEMKHLLELLDLNAVFKHEPSGTIYRFPCLRTVMNDNRVIIEDRFVTEMLWAIPADAEIGKWSRCEIEC